MTKIPLESAYSFMNSTTMFGTIPKFLNIFGDVKRSESIDAEETARTESDGPTESVDDNVASNTFDENDDSSIISESEESSTMESIVLVESPKKTPPSCAETKAKPPDCKLVSFFPQVIMYDHIHRRDYEAEERASTWYAKEEFRDMHKENVLTVQRMILGSSLEDDWCSRGLECRTPVGARVRMMHRREAINAVLTWQGLGPEVLSQVYVDRSEESGRIARIAASVDSQAADVYYSEDLGRSTVRMTSPAKPYGTPGRYMRRLPSSSPLSPIQVRAE